MLATVLFRQGQVLRSSEMTEIGVNFDLIHILGIPPMIATDLLLIGEPILVRHHHLADPIDILVVQFALDQHTLARPRPVLFRFQSVDIAAEAAGIGVDIAHLLGQGQAGVWGLDVWQGFRTLVPAVEHLELAYASDVPVRSA